MNVGTGIILGLLVGALAMFLADWFFYRDRRVCAEAEEQLRETNNLLINERDGLKQQVKSFDGQAARVGTLQADLDTRTKQYNLLLSDHEESARRFRDLETRFKTNEAAVTQLGELEAKLSEKDAEISNLQAALEARDSELNELNVGLGEMGLIAGGAAGGAGLLAALRSRIGERDDDSRVALESRDAEIAELRAELETRDAELGNLRAELDAVPAAVAVTNDAELEELRARLAEREGELAELNTTVAAQSAELSSLRGALDIANLSINDGEQQSGDLSALRLELNDLRGQLAERDAQLSELNAEVDGLDIDWGKMGLAAGGAAAGGGLLARLRGLGKRVNEQESQLAATPEAEPIELNPYVINLQGSLNERDAELAELRARWDAQSAEIDNLRGELSTHASYDDELAALRLQLEERDAEMGRIRAEASARSAELQRLNAELEGRASGSAEIDSLRSAISERDNEIVNLRAQLDTVESELGDDNMNWLAGAGVAGAGGAVVAMKTRLSDLEAQVADRDAQILALRKGEVEPDDLTRVWGIGAAIASKLNDSGIYTFEQLAKTEQHEIDAILAGSGSRFRLATPAIRATWQEQARLAAVGDWDALDYLQTHVRNEKPDNMTRIWGLDAEIERSLATRGIDTYRELEEVSYDEVLPELEMVQANYPHYSKREIHSYWVQQSRWAMNEDWDAIESQFASLATPPEPDDLTRVWGIGAGLEGILNANGIYTFAQLAEAPEQRLDEIIEKAGPRYRVATRNLHNTWSAQADMAAADDWEALEVYQDKLSWSDEDSEQ